MITYLLLTLHQQHHVACRQWPEIYSISTAVDVKSVR